MRRFAEAQRLANEEGLEVGSYAHTEALREWEEENEELLLVEGSLSADAISASSGPAIVDHAGTQRQAIATAPQSVASLQWPASLSNLASSAPAFVPLSAFFGSVAPALAPSSAEFVPPSAFAYRVSPAVSSGHPSAEGSSVLTGTTGNPSGTAWQAASAWVPPDHWAPAQGPATL